MAPTRITVSKNDEATVIAEKIIDAKGDAIVLIVPRFSKIGERKRTAIARVAARAS